MRTRRYVGGRLLDTARRAGCALAVFALAGCQTAQPDSEVLGNLAELQIRMQLLQGELTAVRVQLAERERGEAEQNASDELLRARLEVLQTRLRNLPEQMAEMCPELPDSATVTTQCENTPQVQRVVVSGDRLVVGGLERVWVEPPAASLVARIDAGADSSTLHASEIVEFERDGKKWVRFALPVEDAEEDVSVERALKRYVRQPDGNGGNGTRRPAVELRVQLGDVRENVEFALSDADAEYPVVLGRNFLTDVALVDVARTYVQPAFRTPRN